MLGILTVYALYFEDDKESLGIFDVKTQAMLTAKRLSREKRRRVVAIFNDRSGNTTVCCKFEDGRLVYDGKCCPTPRSTLVLALDDPRV